MLSLSLKISDYTVLTLLLLVMTWDHKALTWSDEMSKWRRRYDTASGYCWCVIRKFICFGWSWITEPWFCQGLDVRSRCVDGWGSQVGMQWDSARFHHTSQNGLQLKTLKLFLSRVFHLIFSDHSWWWVTEPQKAKLQIKWDYSSIKWGGSL